MATDYVWEAENTAACSTVCNTALLYFTLKALKLT